MLQYNKILVMEDISQTVENYNKLYGYMHDKPRSSQIMQCLK